jgi:membrane-bound lytic murein transglycosylase MltF
MSTERIPLTYDEVAALVKENNKSQQFSDEFVICLTWKESGFRPWIISRTTSATGLMQMTKGAVEMVNKCAPRGIHFTHDDMTDAAKCIQCGTCYLDIAEEKLAGVDKSFGTGLGYSKNIRACEVSLKSDKHPMASLHLIHD